MVYKTAGRFQAKLDLYIRYDNKPGPTILYIHGGGWTNGGKEQWVLWYLPYLELGMRVVSVQYRLSGVVPAPAAVEDCRCALRWVVGNAARYGIDPRRIVISGGSAGGRLSLLTGMVTSAAGFDQDCPGQDEPRPAAIINYYGVTGLARAVEEKSKPALAWLRGPGGRLELARRLSPLTCVREGLPPVLTLHGDAGETVLYQDAVRLHRALDARAGPRPGLSSPPAPPLPGHGFPGSEGPAYNKTGLENRNSESKRNSGDGDAS